MADTLIKNMAQLAKVKKDDAFKHLKIIQDHRERGTKFVDSEFPPEEPSLIRRLETPAKWRTYVWRRATDFLPADRLKVFDQIDPNDILQGQLGDCYFLSCLSALAERPKLVERLFLTEECNEAGCYAVWLNDNGEWKNFIIDDFFPCTNSRSGPCFTRSNGPELWVLLLEKAYAKMHGSYDIIEGGDPAWALRDLTGAPWDFIDSNDPDKVWRFIIESERMQYLITCYTKNTNIREEQNPLGIVYGHAYSILDAKEVITDNGSVRLIRIRNPWGKFEWKGDWGDDSDKWTENTKAQVNYENRDDGTFWMNVADFVNYYEGVGICKLHENYQYKSISFDHKISGKNYSMFRLVVPEKTHIFLSVNQKDDRAFDPNMQYEYSTMRFMLGRVDQNGLTYIDGKFFNDRNLVLENTLTPGYYIVIIEFYWRQNIHQQANLSAYSEKRIEFEEMSRADLNLIQKNLLKSYALGAQPSQAAQPIKPKTYAGQGAPRITKYAGSHLGMVFFYYNNQEYDKALQERVNCTKISNLQIMPPFQDDSSFNVQVLPQDDFLVAFKIINEVEAFSFSPSASSSVVEADPAEVEANQQYAYQATTYIDDPNDKTDQSRDVSYYDDYIRSNVDIYPEDPTNLAEIVGKRKEPGMPAQPIQPAQTVQTAQFGQPIELDIPRSSAGQPDFRKSDVVVVPPADQLAQRGSNIFDLRLWMNFPKYVTDDGRLGRWSIKGFERAYSDIVNPFFSNALIDKVFFLMMVLMTLTALLGCQLKNNFIDIMLMMSLVMLFISRFSTVKVIQDNNLALRVYPYLFLSSTFLDLAWLLVYGWNWRENDVTDESLLLGVKTFVILMAMINFVSKALFALILWWKVVNILKSKK